MPIINRQDAAEVDQYIQRIFAAPSAQRPQALRRFFVEKLDFANATSIVSLANAPKVVALPPSAERIASMEGLHVVYVPLSGNGPDRVRKAEAAAAAKLIADTLQGDLLLVMTNRSGSQLHVIYPTFVGVAPSLRRMIIERFLPRRTAVQQLSNIFWHWKDTGSIGSAVNKAFDVEAVTKEFFAKYRSVFGSVMASVNEGFGKSEAEQEAKKLFVQTLFNRLMFIYFLSRKGWLKFKGEKDYLNALWKDYPARPEDKNFYDNRLKVLFFSGLNNERSADLMRNNPAMYALIGDVPFLNGGLFDKTPEDQRPNVLVPDAAIDLILHQLFDQFNFTVMESTPFDVEVAVDPEMLGKVFEELVTGRHESGSYYTPRPVVAFMCREALKGYLETQNTGASTEAIAAFVDHKDTSRLALSTAPKVGEALARVKVVDPACGSGAYLLGMMQELVELMTALYSDHLSHQAQDLYNLKLRIIEQNLYGADIDQFAVNIAMLRLWLSLAIDYDGPVPPPLPNLDFKIVCGDSLLGPDPSPENYGTLFRHRVHQLAGQLSTLKDRHMRATGQEKTNLTKDIEGMKAQLREALAESAAPEGVVDWRVEFAEVFDQNGGFDVAIANPPYVNMITMETTASEYRSRVRENFKTARGAFDIFVPFMERGIQIIKPRGMTVYITPNKLLSAEYSSQLRDMYDSTMSLLTVVDLSSIPIFQASVYPVITIGVKESPSSTQDSVTVYRGQPDPQNPDGVTYVQTTPKSVSRSLRNLWSPLIALETIQMLPALTGKLLLDDVAEITAGASVDEAYKWRDALVDEGADLALRDPERYAPFIVSGNVRAHHHTWAQAPVRYLKSSYKCPVIDLGHPAISVRRVAQVRKPKIIVSGMSLRPTCFWDQRGIAVGVPGLYVIPKDGVNGAYLAGVINSRIMAAIYRILFGSLALAGGYLRFGSPQLKLLPVPAARRTEQEAVADLVTEFAQERNVQEQERVGMAIDDRVADLYGLELSGHAP